MKEFLKHNWFKVSVLILIGVAIFGYFSFRSNELQAKANKEVRDKIAAQQEREDIQKEKEKNQFNLASCLGRADVNYQINFESYCISEGRGANCQSILRSHSDIVDAIEKEEKANCFKKYPQN